MNSNRTSKKANLIIGLALTTALGFLAFFNGYDLASGQPTSDLNIGNTTSESSDTFFQLVDSIELMKSLVNETQSSIDNGDSTEAHYLLNQIYNELMQISNNSNNLIWDLSNEGN